MWAAGEESVKMWNEWKRERRERMRSEGRVKDEEEDRD